MQQFVATESDDKNKNTSSNNMPPQVQLQGQTTTAMQQLHQPFQQQLPQFQNWDNSQQQQSDLLSIRTSLEPSSQTTGQANIPNRVPSPTSISLESSSIKSNGSSSRIIKGSQSSSLSSMGKSNSTLSPLLTAIPTPRSNAAFSPRSNAAFSITSGVKRGSGVDIKGPTPEVAQQLRFPWKLHLLLERCEYEHQQKLATAAAEGTSPNRVQDQPISWLPTGKAFKVHDKERFVKEVMPSFFGTQSFKTFQRNLNLWGFTRVSKGPSKDVCSHPLFLKGFPAVCQSMKRIVLKGTGRGNRAPLGGVDVSSVQAVVAAAAMQQAQQQQAQQQQILGQSPVANSMALSQVPPHIQTLQGQQIKTGNDVNMLSHINLQNPQQGQVMQNQYQPQQQQQQQFVIENGTIQAAPVPSQQNLLVLPSAPPAPSSATTTVMWPNNQQQLQQLDQPFNMVEANATLQKSLSQLSTIIQQLNGNVVQSSGANPTFQQQAQQQLNPTPMLQQQQQQQQQQPQPQQPMLMQQQQQTAIPNTVVTPSPMSTQDLVTLLLQRNLQQQVSQAPTNQAAPASIQLQVPSSLFPGQQTTLQQQQPNSTLGQGFQQQQGTAMFSQQPQQQQPPQNLVAAAPGSPTANQQQQNQLLQLLLQQNGWATSAAPI